MPDYFDFGTADKAVIVRLKQPVTIGEFNSTSKGYGVSISSAQTKALDVCADDNGVALTAGSYRAVRSRMLLTAAVTADVSVDGGFGQLKVGAVSIGGIGSKSGVDGYIEAVSGATLAGNGLWAAVRGRLDIPSGATLSGAYGACAFGCFYDDLGGTLTTKPVVLQQGPTKAGTWSALARVTAAGGCYQASIGSAASKGLFVYVDDTLYCIPLHATS